MLNINSCAEFFFFVSMTLCFFNSHVSPFFYWNRKFFCCSFMNDEKYHKSNNAKKRKKKNKKRCKRRNIFLNKRPFGWKKFVMGRTRCQNRVLPFRFYGKVCTYVFDYTVSSFRFFFFFLPDVARGSFGVRITTSFNGLVERYLRWRIFSFDKC